MATDPLQYSCLENPMDRRAWWATVHGAPKSRTWLSDWAHKLRWWSFEMFGADSKEHLASTHLPTPNKDTIFPDSVIINETKKLFLDFVIKFLIVKGQFCFLEWEGVLKLNLYLHSGYDSLLRVSSHFFSFSKSWFPYLRGIKPKINLWTIAKASTIWTPTLSTHEIRYYLKFWLTL